MFFKFLTLSLSVLSFIAWQGCNNSSNPSTTKTVTNEHHLNKANAGQLLSIDVGDTFDITLQNHGPGEYDTPVISGAVVQFIAETPGTVVIPAGATQIFYFTATERGNAEITITHSGEIATTDNSNNAFILTCKVE
jgi:hypothetical protein